MHHGGSLLVLALMLTASAMTATGGRGLVTVEQFGMSQCPMTTSWTSDFFHRCLDNNNGLSSKINFTLNMVAGRVGGPVNSSTDTESFHGPQEVVADKYQLCARALEPNDGLGSYPTAYQWVNYTSCMNGLDGVGIVAMCVQ